MPFQAVFKTARQWRLNDLAVVLNPTHRRKIGPSNEVRRRVTAGPINRTVAAIGFALALTASTGYGRSDLSLCAHMQISHESHQRKYAARIS